MAADATQAETAVLGSIILDNTVVSIVNERLSPDDFNDALNARIFASAVELDKSGFPIDVSTLTTKLSGDGLFKERGGVFYLANLTANLPSAMQVERYAQLVRNDAIRRKLSAFGARLQADAQSAQLDMEHYLSTAAETMHQIIDDTGARSFCDIRTATQDACNMLMEAMNNGGALRGIQTGFIDLDNLIAGLRPGTLTILAARPAMGKTALALNIICDIAIRQGIPSGMFSLEMTSVELALRILSAQSKVPSDVIRKGSLSETQWDDTMAAVQRYSSAPLYIDDTSGITISTLRDRARRLKMQKDIQFLVVDYLQLLTSGSKRVQNREQEVADIARGLKNLSKELSIPVLALAQLNRAVDARTDKHPFLSDLRESGSIEQDADNILFIHRAGYYDKNTADNTAEIIVAKQRNGATGTVTLQWNGKLTQFSNLENNYE